MRGSTGLPRLSFRRQATTKSGRGRLTRKVARSQWSCRAGIHAATLTTPAIVTTLFIRPFRWGRLVFTYLIPILPLLCLWDGIVSCLRSYSARELRELVRDLESDDYAWDVGELRFPGTPVTVAYLMGWPT